MFRLWSSYLQDVMKMQGTKLAMPAERRRSNMHRISMLQPQL